MLLACSIPQPRRTWGGRDEPHDREVRDFGKYDISLDRDGGSGLTVSAIALTLLVQCRRSHPIPPPPAFGAALSFA
jgi:hypothetical protein